MKKERYKSNETITQTQWALMKAYEIGYRFNFNTNLLEKPNGEKVSLKLLSKFKYPTFNVSIYGNVYTVFIHRLAMYQVYGKILFEKGLLVRHLNDNPMDLRYENLAIGTHRDNKLDIPVERRIEIAKRYVRNNKEPVNKNTSNCVAEEVLREYLPHLKERLSNGYKQAVRGFNKNLTEKYNLNPVVLNSIVVGKSFNNLYVKLCGEYGIIPKRLRCDANVSDYANDIVNFKESLKPILDKYL